VRDFLNKWMFASPEVGWLVGWLLGTLVCRAHSGSFSGVLLGEYDIQYSRMPPGFLLWERVLLSTKEQYKMLPVTN
jgi:hypothetical protein